MSFVSTARTAGRVAWATRAAVRPMAIIPESHQVAQKKAAARVDFWGEPQDIDSRYALLDKVTKKALAVDYRYRVDGKGFMKPWDAHPSLKKQHDPDAHGEAEGWAQCGTEQSFIYTLQQNIDTYCTLYLHVESYVLYEWEVGPPSVGFSRCLHPFNSLSENVATIQHGPMDGGPLKKGNGPV